MVQSDVAVFLSCPLDKVGDYQSLSVKTADKSILNRHSVVMLPGESYPLKFKLQSSENIQFGNIPIKISLFKSKATYFCKTQESGIFEHVILDFSEGKNYSALGRLALEGASFGFGKQRSHLPKVNPIFNIEFFFCIYNRKIS